MLRAVLQLAGKFPGEWVTVVVTPVPEWCLDVPRGCARVWPGEWWADRQFGGWVMRYWI